MPDTKHPIRILHLEDSPRDAELIQAKLEAGGLVCDIVRVDSKEQFEAALAGDSFDLVLCDHNLNGYDGFSAMKLIRRKHPETPVMLISGTLGEEEAVKCLQHGATDYLLKQRLDRLPSAVQRALDDAAKQQKLQNLRAEEERLKEQHRAELRTIVNGTLNALLVVDQKGFIRFHNPAAENLFDRGREELDGQPFGFPVDTVPEKPVIVDIRCRDGTARFAEMRVARTVWNGQPASVVSMQDITERKQAEEAMQRMQAELEQSNRDLQHRNQEIQTFYHTLSHELKTPLTSAREFVSIVMDGLAGPLNETQLEYLATAKESCDQLRVYINDLLDVTRLETGKLTVQPKPVSLGRLAERIVRMMQPVAGSKGIDLQTDLAPDLPEAVLDESRLMQVLSNLLNNALKFTATGGKIRVQVGLAPHRPDFQRVSVSDTGRGIPADQQEHIFDRLYQVKTGAAATEGGLGLGLYICRELVELHGGTIWVESAPGQGSAFSFEVPLSQRARQPQILIVDDAPDILTGLRAHLEREHFNVTSAGGGTEALQQMQRQLPDVVLMDLQMPHPDGADTLKEIRKTWGAIPVILHTAYPDSELMMRALQESPFTVLAKPCAAQQLLEAVRTAVAFRKPRRGEGIAASPFASVLAESHQPEPRSKP